MCEWVPVFKSVRVCMYKDVCVQVCMCDSLCLPASVTCGNICLYACVVCNRTSKCM